MHAGRRLNSTSASWTQHQIVFIIKSVVVCTVGYAGVGNAGDTPALDIVDAGAFTPPSAVAAAGMANAGRLGGYSHPTPERDGHGGTRRTGQKTGPLAVAGGRQIIFAPNFFAPLHRKGSGVHLHAAGVRDG